MWASELPGYFKEIGARLVVDGEDGRGLRLRYRTSRQRPNGRPTPRGRDYTLDIAHDADGEHFTLNVTPTAPDFRILQARRDERHLLLYAAAKPNAERFLCGHDERHWFVAAVGEPVSTVMAARRALLPRDLRDKGLNKTTLTTRHNDIFKRQGEWFFVPVRDPKLLAAIGDLPIHRHEPIQRGARNKPHRVDELVRVGGTTVYLHGGEEHSVAEWENLMREPDFRRKVARVEQRVKDMTVYCRGAVRHADHATIWLDGWHSVMVNGEVISSSVVFYD